MSNIRQLTTTLALATLTAFCVAGLAHAADVVLNVAGERGQGSLLRRGNECLVVTPRHVVWDSILESPVVTPIDVTYADRTITTATVFKDFKDDVALLRLAEQPRSGCLSERFEGRNLDVHLQSPGEALLKRRQEDGSDLFTLVQIAGFDAVDSIRVKPFSDSIDQGDSGSVLYLDNRPVGMLTNVENDVGVVMRADKLMSIIGPFLAASQRDNSLFISLDASSSFLETKLSRLANRRGIVMTDDASAARLKLNITSEETRLDSDTGKVVRYTTRIEIVDALDNLVIEEEIKAAGNSFISLNAAAENAREDLATQLGNTGLMERLP